MSANRRVLCLTSNFPRWEGDSTTPFVLHLNQDLAELGWEVEVLAPHAPGARHEEVLGGLQVHRFSYAWPESAETVCYQGGAMVNLRERPWEKVKLPMLVAAQWWAAQRLVRSGRYDLVHSHWVLPQGFVGSLATALEPLPHVITLHGGDLFTLRGAAMTAFKRHSLKRASAVTVNSSFTEDATARIAPSVPIERIPMGVDARPLSESEIREARRIREAIAGDGGGPVVVFVGRLVPEKGAEDALSAMGELAKSFPEARLMIIGDGPRRRHLEEERARLGLEGRVHLLGWVQPNQVRAHMAAADVFVGPSKTGSDGWVEAQGLTFLEAMAVGVPVVATRSGGIVDSVRHEETGLLVNEADPVGIARAVTRLVRDVDLCKRLAREARARLESEFTRQVSAARFAGLFERLLEY